MQICPKKSPKKSLQLLRVGCLVLHVFMLYSVPHSSSSPFTMQTKCATWTLAHARRHYSCYWFENKFAQIWIIILAYSCAERTLYKTLQILQNRFCFINNVVKKLWALRRSLTFVTSQIWWRQRKRGTLSLIRKNQQMREGRECTMVKCPLFRFGCVLELKSYFYFKTKIK